MKLTQFKTKKAALDATALADKLGDAEPYPRASLRRNGKPGAMVNHWWGPPVANEKGTVWGVKVHSLDEETGEVPDPKARLTSKEAADLKAYKLAEKDWDPTAITVKPAVLKAKELKR